MRLFLAIDIPPEIKGKITGVQKEIGVRVHGWRWLPSGSLHLTLKFMGEQDETVPDRIGEKLSSLKKGAFSVSLSGIGAFPSLSSARVIWLGIGKGKEEAVDLQRRIEEGISFLGLREEREFSPHITIARNRETVNIKKYQEFLSEKGLGDSWTAEGFSLYSSILRPGGAEYQKISFYHF